MSSHPAEACVNCDFFVKSVATPGGAHTLDVSVEERSKSLFQKGGLEM